MLSSLRSNFAIPTAAGSDDIGFADCLALRLPHGASSVSIQDAPDRKVMKKLGEASISDIVHAIAVDTRD
jgi:hypothetical protein